ncbi:pantoate-beta-alanine ligase [Rhizina undulata]
MSSIPPTTPPLQIYTTVPSLRSWRHQQLLSSRPVALVPTMGALHAGHLSLIRTAAETHPSIVVSIFVNPAQFAPHEDLAQYPRTLDKDLEQLTSLNASLESSGLPGRIESLFLPAVSELYPNGIPLQQDKQKGAFVTVTPLSSKLEGITRPHFFRGVATICSKLFNIVQPNTAFFGQKDVQQTIVLKRLVRDLLFPVEIVVGPTVREEDGLAMSSRNVYLGPNRREKAVCLYHALQAVEQCFEAAKTARIAEVGREELLEKARRVIADAGEGVELEYISLADSEELEELDVVRTGEGAVLSGAVKMLPTGEGEGVVRIIDNIILRGA